MTRKYHNPGYKRHMLSVPFRALIIGSSGAGKTNCLLELIHRFSGTFERIVICTKDKNEPLYEFLEMKLGGKGVEIYEGSENIPALESFKNCGQSLICFDDLVLEKDQSVISQYFIRGRKIGGGVSCAYLSQSYYKTPKVIRLQIGYLFLKKLSSKRDLTMILSEVSIGTDIKGLTALYKKATEDPLSFLLIDIAAPDEKRCRAGFLEIL